MSLRIHSPSSCAVPPLGWKVCCVLLMCNGMQTANQLCSNHRCIVLCVPNQNCSWTTAFLTGY